MLPRATNQRVSLCLLFCCAAAPIARLPAADWPQWNGPTRDGKVTEQAQISFPNAAEPLWKTDVSLGYSGPVVTGNRLIVTDYLLDSGEITNNAGKRDRLSGRERVLCLDAATGDQVWQHAYRCEYNLSYPGGPRATPAIYNGRVYTLGSEGDLLCLNMSDGKVIWRHAFSEEFGAQTPFWGHAASPLVYDDKLICMVGGAGSLVVAFDLTSGDVMWKALTSDGNETGYCPPVVIHAGQTDQLMIWDPTTLRSLNPNTGQEYWAEQVAPGYGMSILPPISDGEFLFVSGEKQTSAMLRLGREEPTAELLWRGSPKTSLYLATSGAVFDGDHIYGADISTGALICFEAHSGQRKWQSSQPTAGTSRGRAGAHASAFLIKLGNDYVILSETGDLIHAKLSPEGYSESARFHAIDPTNRSMGRDVLWTYPAYAGGCIFVRNDKKLICYRIIE